MVWMTFRRDRSRQQRKISRYLVEDRFELLHLHHLLLVLDLVQAEVIMRIHACCKYRVSRNCMLRQRYGFLLKALFNMGSMHETP